MAEEDEFERIARENKDLQENEWTKVPPFPAEGISASVDADKYQAAAHILREGLRELRLPVEKVLSILVVFEWPVRVHLLHAAIGEYMDWAKVNVPQAKWQPSFERLDLMLQAFADLMERPFPNSPK